MSAPVGPYPPNNGLVAQAWLAQRVTGLTAAMVAGRLPADVTAWADLGFVQVTPVTGVPDVDVPIRKPLVQVDCWATTVDAAGNVSTRQPIGKAWRLAELIRVATEADTARYSSLVVLPADYDSAIVLSAWLQTEPSEVADDPSGYARVTFDLELNWARA